MPIERMPTIITKSDVLRLDDSPVVFDLKTARKFSLVHGTDFSNPTKNSLPEMLRRAQITVDHIETTTLQRQWHYHLPITSFLARNNATHFLDEIVTHTNTIEDEIRSLASYVGLRPMDVSGALYTRGSCAVNAFVDRDPKIDVIQQNILDFFSKIELGSLSWYLKKGPNLEFFFELHYVTFRDIKEKIQRSLVGKITEATFSNQPDHLLVYTIPDSKPPINFIIYHNQDPVSELNYQRYIHGNYYHGEKRQGVSFRSELYAHIGNNDRQTRNVSSQSRVFMNENTLRAFLGLEWVCRSFEAYDERGFSILSHMPHEFIQPPLITPELYARVIRLNAVFPLSVDQKINIIIEKICKTPVNINEFIGNFMVAFLTDACFTIRSFNQVNLIYQINWLDKITDQIADQIDQEEDIKTKLIIFISAIRNNFEQRKNLSYQEVADVAIEILKTSFN